MKKVIGTDLEISDLKNIHLYISKGRYESLRLG